ncbi:hypothetical protein VKT23_009647 [Stygiomarasmius scandens]|uniref:DUF6534 domain-containing protein n=1 Tax=Marasmiellus scandens TaxID=2682957 RepID=A0ABR1JJ04_9AGAR
MSGLPPNTNLGPTLGAVEVGVLVATVLYGTVLVQTYNYFHGQFQDRTSIKLLVVFLCLLETVDTGFLWAYLYSRTVDHFGNSEILQQSYWALACSVPVANLVVFIVQLFFAYRVYKVSTKRIYPIICIPASMFRLAMGFAIAVTMTMESLSMSEYVIKFKWLMVVALSVGAAVDISNTVALYVCLQMRTGVQPGTQRILDKLVLWTIETALLTSLCGVLEVVLMATSDQNLLWIFFFFQTPKLYSNALLASLNGRALLQNIRQAVSVNTDSRSFQAGRRTNVEVRIDVDVDTGEPTTPNRVHFLKTSTSDEGMDRGMELHSMSLPGKDSVTPNGSIYDAESLARGRTTVI